MATNQPVPHRRRSGEERFERRQANRGKWVKRGMIAFGAVLILSVPLELHQFAESNALNAKEVILRADELQLGGAPFIDFGPSGRTAVGQFGTGSWIKPAARRLCNTVESWTGDVEHIKVGFLEASEGATGIVAASCQTTSGFTRLVIGRYSPPGVLAKVLLAANKNVTMATVIATPRTLYLQNPVYGESAGPLRPAKVAIATL
ncbi:hypothetical protein [Ferrimicrobium sp.]|uniref:hypothetical protein n=1 Tax=Ferrimicrobium sp. TaxID=2926050 RepID=UPI002608F1AC|nr:hypothetical protein [Ferrimicrobium sp.]